MFSCLNNARLYFVCSLEVFLCVCFLIQMRGGEQRFMCGRITYEPELTALEQCQLWDGSVNCQWACLHKQKPLA